MILRLLLMFWTMSLALPGAALACHDPIPTASAVHSAHHAPAEPRDAVVDNDLCLGCIPPSAWNSASVPAPMLAKPLPRLIALARIDRISPTPPALPPPRRG